LTIPGIGGKSWALIGCFGKTNKKVTADFGAELFSTRAEFEGRKHPFWEQTEAESHFLAADSAKD